MLSTVKCLVKSGSKLKTFNENNRWVGIGEFSTITPELVKTTGLMFDTLITPKDNIKLLWEKLKDNEDGSAIYYSEDILKTMMVSNIEAVTENAVDKLKLTVAQFIPKDKLVESDLIYSYSTDPLYKPQIVNVAFSDTVVHDKNINMIIDTVYNYDEKVKYAVKINDGEYGPWTSELVPFNKITLHVINKDLRVGDNTISIKVATIDETKVTEKVMANAIRVDNSQPSVTIITADSNAFKVHFRIEDEDVTDTISYKLSLVNSKGTFEITDWSEHVVQPIEAVHHIDTTDVVVDAPNTIKIEYKDNFGVSGTSEYRFTGTYNNVVFTDENGDYYVTDKGIMLKLLEFEDLPAGKTSEIKEIKLKNSSANDIQNLVINVTDMVNTEGISVQFSKTKYPFVPLTIVDYGSQIIESGEVLDLFIRMDTSMEAKGVCDFAIEANSDMAETPVRYIL